ncbi:MAG TPA: hypothetical protein VHV57_12115 [Acidimicrobiales bacterium]|jgi:hypothetical protein|nr:hypothetical protein [Acidimicrobiales bacterium]
MGRSAGKYGNKRIIASAAVVGMALGGLALQTTAGATPGSAKAKVTVGSKTYKLSGGACVISGTTLQVGVGSKPNSLGINGTLKGGKFKNAQIGMVLKGKPVAITTDSGKASASGGSFSGTDVVSHSKVKGTFTC